MLHDTIEPTIPAADSTTPAVVFRTLQARIEPPIPADGPAIAALVRASKGLDPNSDYAYVMVCDVFADTTLVARDDSGCIVAFVSGFVRPSDPSRLFLWQVGILPTWRGRGLATSLLEAFVRTPAARRASFLETTITADNVASLRLFSSFAATRNEVLHRVRSYPGEWLGQGHATEDVYSIRLTPTRARP